MALTDEDKQWIIERLERLETTLLTEFHKWASPLEARQRTHSATLRAIDMEMESLWESRISRTARPAKIDSDLHVLRGL